MNDLNDRGSSLGRAQRRWIVVGAAVIAAVAAIVLLTVTWSAPGGTTSPGLAQPPVDSPTASMNSTDVNGSTRALELEIRSTSDDDQLDISVNPTVEAQHVDGSGAAMTHASADLFSRMPSDERAALFEELFAADGPVRLSVLRLPIGASDFVDTDAFTFDDLPNGDTDWGLDRFDIGPDREAMIPMLQEILAVNPEVRLIASPWSPPAWLKTAGSLEGGRLLDEDAAYETYAAYLVRFVEEYRAAGLTIDMLTVQNEPQFRYPDGYPGTDMPVWQQAMLIERLGPALGEAGLDTAILGFDHNWELNPGDAATTPDGENPAYQYPTDLLRTPAAAWIDGIAFHCYYGSAEVMTRLWEQFPDMEIWVTECSGSSAFGESAQKVFADTLAWQSANLLIPSMRNRAAGVLTWNLALDESGGPHRGGCATCTAVVTIASDGTVTRNAEYYVLAHAARYVPKGSVRIDSTSDVQDLSQVAFRTPDATTVIVVWNPSDAPQSIDVGDDEHTLGIELPPSSLNTITWQAAS